MAKEEIVTLQATRTFSPYAKGEVFGLPKSQADAVVKATDGDVKYYKGKPVSYNDHRQKQYAKQDQKKSGGNQAQKSKQQAQKSDQKSGE